MKSPATIERSQLISNWRSWPALTVCSRNQPVPAHKRIRKAQDRSAAPTSARSHSLFHAEDSKPADNAQHIALAFTSTDNAACDQLTPPIKKGTVSTGTTASDNVNALNPWTSPLATTTSVPVNGVRKSSPNVPSRRSRLMQ